MKKNNPILKLLNCSTKYQSLKHALETNSGAISVFGLCEMAKANIASGLSNDTDSTILYVVPTEADCVRMEGLFSAFEINAVHFPAKSLTFDNMSAAAGGTSFKRIQALIGLVSSPPEIVIASAEALMQKLPPKNALIDNIIRIKIGDTVDIKKAARELTAMGYEREELCTASGQFCLHGGRIDVFPINSLIPYRIELFDDEVDTMRTFDAQTQRSIENTSECIIFPASEVIISEEIISLLEKKHAKAFESYTESGKESSELLLTLVYENPACIIDYLPENKIVLIDEPLKISESAKIEYTIFSESVESAVSENKTKKYLWDLLFTPSEIFIRLNTKRTAMFFMLSQSFSLISPKVIIQMATQPASMYMKNEELFASDLLSYRESGTTTVIFAGTHAKSLFDKLTESAKGINPIFMSKLSKDIASGEIVIVAESFISGVYYIEDKTAIITENELFSSLYRQKSSEVNSRRNKNAADRLTVDSLSVGDFVVHETNGIGRYMGVETLTADKKTRDYIVLQYAAGDKLYIPTDQMDRIQKYVSQSAASEVTAPTLSKLGGNEWQKTVSRVKAGVKKLAFDLVALYGERMNKTGYIYSKDTMWQRELENSFPYEETPDQLTCIEEIKRDMESPKIMDRLLCGDVGFGKTEVALRMAFKAAQDSKQVAFLVPTTILAYQHYTTLSSRFANYPITVECLSRFKTPAEQKEIIKKVKTGEIDVLVGTHRILSKDVVFRDLGLLIVDEEQRFGVAHKEQIKELKKAVDVLTLTATPIPRTLHMSLIGLRDISVIETPPSQRYPVQTYVTEFSDALIKEAIQKEIGRGGQVYFLYNNVQNMDSFYSYLCDLLPNIHIRYAHGQMNEHLLEETMLSFLKKEFDVLLCSTIIENGLDIPNVNTIIIYDADKLGLSQLYQLKGRVGRGTRLGYAYLTYQHNKVFTEEAAKRLMAIKEFTKLGMGHRIALRDLQIRGAGNVLGPEQHGHMEQVGYEMYRKMMKEAIDEAKGIPPEIKRPDSSVEVPISAYIPKTYITNEAQRLAMYKRIADIKTNDDVMDVQDELTDRFGDIPKEVMNLIQIAIVRALASEAFISKVTLSDGEVQLIFMNDNPYEPTRFMTFIASNKNARFTDYEVPTLTVKKSGATALQLLGMLPRFFGKLEKCMELE